MWGPFRSRRSSEDALRRLGGPDVEAERKKNAMSGEQKFWALAVTVVASLLAWVAWNVNDYNSRVAALEASSRPSAEETLMCIDTCSRSCLSSEDR